MKKTLFIALTLSISLIACSQTKQTATTKMKNETYTGSYRSIMGVMNPLSCYCSNGGYLTISDEEKISISFDELNIDKVRSGEITVSGSFEEITHESGEMDPCLSGTRQILIVKSFSIKE